MPSADVGGVNLTGMPVAEAGFGGLGDIGKKVGKDAVSKAFNVDTIILSENSVDIYNDKVLRSTQGMIFHMNIIYGDLELIIKDLIKRDYVILGTDVNNGEDVRNISLSKYALVMGNEGHGVSEKVRNLCNKNLYIKMNDDCESLNVAVATSILLYELNRSNHD